MLIAMMAQVFTQPDPRLVVRDHQAAMDAAWELLARTVELPETKRELPKVLGEYRRALFEIASREGAADQLVC